MVWILFGTGLMITATSITEAKGKVAIAAMVALIALGVGTMIAAIYLRSLGL